MEVLSIRKSLRLQRALDSTLCLSGTSLQVLDAYISHVRPLLKPNCDYVLVTKKGNQHTKIDQLMGKMVFDAAGKYIHPTRYRQIVETTSQQQLDTKEKETISEDQKHSSVVAKVHYQKQRSRDIATKAHECLKKLHGEKGSQVDDDVSVRLSDSPNSSPGSDKEQVNIDAGNSNVRTTQESNSIKPGQSRKKKIMLFSTEEDNYLKSGIERYGFGQWSVILRDPEYRFQKGRTANSLLRRAMRKFFQC